MSLKKKRLKLTKGHWCTRTDLPLGATNIIAINPTGTRLVHEHSCLLMSSGSPHTIKSYGLDRLSGFHAELQTPSGHMTSHPHVDLSSPAVGESRDAICDNLSAGQESHHSISHTRSPKINDNAVSWYQCADCSKQYRRKAEMSRHARSHNKEGRIDCPIPSCKFRGPKGNTRQDKFINHIVRGHPEVAAWQCWADTCDRKFPNVLLLGVHLASHDEYCYPGTPGPGEAIMKAHLIERSRCPVEGCKKPLTPKHIFRDHDQKERQTEADTLRAMGFEHQQSALLCPVCDEKFLCTEDRDWAWKDLPKLRGHMVMEHLGGNRADQDGNIPDRLLLMWKDPHTLVHCREQILRLHVRYRRHAIFDDIRV